MHQMNIGSFGVMFLQETEQMLFYQTILMQDSR
jgi:hypothetical protein